MRVGIIGLGGFGVKVAARLVEKDLNPEIYDIDHMAMRFFNNDIGGMMTGSPKSMAQSCTLIVTVMPTAEALREVFFGWEGLALGLRPGTVVFDMSGCEPATTRKIAEQIRPTGALLVDAPALGTPAQARAGALTLLVGGDEAAVEQCRPVLAALATTVHRTGDVGSGHALVALGGYLRATGLLAMAEAMTMGERAGVDPAALATIAASLGILAPTVTTDAQQQMLTDRLDSGTRIRQFRQDLAICRAMSGTDHPTPALLDANAAAWQAAEATLGSGADVTAILGWLRRQQLPEAPAVPAAA